MRCIVYIRIIPQFSNSHTSHKCDREYKPGVKITQNIFWRDIFFSRPCYVHKIGPNWWRGIFFTHIHITNLKCMSYLLYEMWRMNHKVVWNARDDNFIGGIFIAIKAIYMQCQCIDSTVQHITLYYIHFERINFYFRISFFHIFFVNIHTHTHWHSHYLNTRLYLAKGLTLKRKSQEHVVHLVYIAIAQVCQMSTLFSVCEFSLFHTKITVNLFVCLYTSNCFLKLILFSFVFLA